MKRINYLIIKTLISLAEFILKAIFFIIILYLLFYYFGEIFKIDNIVVIFNAHGGTLPIDATAVSNEITTAVSNEITTVNPMTANSRDVDWVAEGYAKNDPLVHYAKKYNVHPEAIRF
jgi:hypothetical protein